MLIDKEEDESAKINQWIGQDGNNLHSVDVLHDVRALSSVADSGIFFQKKFTICQNHAV